MYQSPGKGDVNFLAEGNTGKFVGNSLEVM